MKRSAGDTEAEGGTNKRARKPLGDLTNTTELEILEVPAFNQWDRCFAKFEASGESVYPATIVEIIAKKRSYAYSLIYHDGDSKTGVSETWIDKVSKHPKEEMVGIDLRTMEATKSKKLKTALSKFKATVSKEGWIVSETYAPPPLTSSSLQDVPSSAASEKQVIKSKPLNIVQHHSYCCSLSKPIYCTGGVY